MSPVSRLPEPHQRVYSLREKIAQSLNHDSHSPGQDEYVDFPTRKVGDVSEVLEKRSPPVSNQVAPMPKSALKGMKQNSLPQKKNVKFVEEYHPDSEKSTTWLYGRAAATRSSMPSPSVSPSPSPDGTKTYHQVEKTQDYGIRLKDQEDETNHRSDVIQSVTTDLDSLMRTIKNLKQTIQEQDDRSKKSREQHQQEMAKLKAHLHEEFKTELRIMRQEAKEHRQEERDNQKGEIRSLERNFKIEKDSLQRQLSARERAFDETKSMQHELQDLFTRTMESLNEHRIAQFLQVQLDKESAECTPPLGLQSDWSGRGSYAIFSKEESIPLEHGRVLGKGANGEVIEVACKNAKLALKRIGHRRRILPNERREIEILKKLSHRHVINLVGTYIQPPVLGILLYPAAQCDLLLALDFLDNKKQHPETYLEDDHLMGRLTDHRLTCGQMEEIVGPSGELLYPRFGCLASAMAYLHANNIRHKDVKPSNILLSREGTWITDFGMAKDFTPDLTSTSESRERGTLVYCAPEVAAYEDSGRSADIFSLGCVFLEMITALEGNGLAKLQSLCPKRNKSYEANLDRIDEWMASQELRDNHHTGLLLTEINRMLLLDRKLRPTAEAIILRIAAIDAHHDSAIKHKFCGTCCDPWQDKRRIVSSQQLRDLQNQGRTMVECVFRTHTLSTIPHILTLILGFSQRLTGFCGQPLSRKAMDLTQMILRRQLCTNRVVNSATRILRRQKYHHHQKTSRDPESFSKLSTLR